MPPIDNEPPSDAVNATKYQHRVVACSCPPGSCPAGGCLRQHITRPFLGRSCDFRNRIYRRGGGHTARYCPMCLHCRGAQ